MRSFPSLQRRCRPMCSGIFFFLTSTCYLNGNLCKVMLLQALDFLDERLHCFKTDLIFQNDWFWHIVSVPSCHSFFLLIRLSNGEPLKDVGPRNQLNSFFSCWKMPSPMLTWRASMLTTWSLITFRLVSFLKLISFMAIAIVISVLGQPSPIHATTNIPRPW